MSLHAEISKIVTAYPDDDPVTLARRLLESLDRESLVVLLAEEIAHEQRGRARSVEQSEWRRFVTRKPVVQPADSSRFARLLRSKVALGDGNGRIELGQLTVEQHEQRIALLVKLRDGIDATISRHVEAVALLRETGARCLDDLLLDEEDAA